MSKTAYRLPLLSRIAIFIADRLPSRIRASLYIDMLESLDTEYERITTSKDKDGSYRVFDAVSSVHVETLRWKAILEGLKGKLDAQ